MKISGYRNTDLCFFYTCANILKDLLEELKKSLSTQKDTLIRKSEFKRLKVLRK